MFSSLFRKSFSTSFWSMLLLDVAFLALTRAPCTNSGLCGLRPELLGGFNTDPEQGCDTPDTDNDGIGIGTEGPVDVVEEVKYVLVEAELTVRVDIWLNEAVVEGID